MNKDVLRCKHCGGFHIAPCYHLNQVTDVPNTTPCNCGQWDCTGSPDPLSPPAPPSAREYKISMPTWLAAAGLWLFSLFCASVGYYIAYLIYAA